MVMSLCKHACEMLVPVHLCTRITSTLTSIHAGGAGGGTTYEALQRADAIWSQLRTKKV